MNKKELKEIADDLLSLHRASWWLEHILYDLSDDDTEFKEMFWCSKSHKIALIKKFIKYLEKI